MRGEEPRSSIMPPWRSRCNSRRLSATWVGLLDRLQEGIYLAWRPRPPRVPTSSCKPGYLALQAWVPRPPSLGASSSKARCLVLQGSVPRPPSVGTLSSTARYPPLHATEVTLPWHPGERTNRERRREGALQGKTTRLLLSFS